MSIRRRLLVALLSALALVGVAASGTTWLAVHREANELFDYHLQQMALGLRDQTPRSPVEDLFPRLDHDFIVQVWDGGDVAYASSRSVLLPHARAGFDTVEANGQDWRIFTMSQPGRVVQVAAPLSLRSDRASAMALRILVPILASIPLFAALIWVLVGQELKPLEAIAAAIRKRAPSSVEPLPEAGLPEEVRPLVAALNALLVRLREAIETQRRFTADAAHELRSPLTALQLQIQLVERARSAEELSQALQPLRAGAKRATRLVEQLLTMARLEPDAEQPSPAAVDLDAIVKAAVAELEPLAEAKGVELNLLRIDLARMDGQAEALHTLVRNLVDNAIRHTPPPGRVAVTLRTEDGGTTLEVADTGPGIPVEERERVFDRFYRLSAGNSQGSGLGLAIVKQIADAHRARIELSAVERGKGLRVTVRFANQLHAGGR